MLRGYWLPLTLLSQVLASGCTAGAARDGGPSNDAQNADVPSMACGLPEDRIYLHGPQDILMLADCTSFRGSVEFTNTRLTDVDGLANLRSVGGDLNFFRNWDLASLGGLRGLVSVGGNLLIHLDDSLETMDGLQQLRSVGGLGIHSNAGLRSLAALQGLESIAGDLVITGNPQLPRTDAETFAARVLVGGTTTVAENMP